MSDVDETPDDTEESLEDLLEEDGAQDVPDVLDDTLFDGDADDDEALFDDEDDGEEPAEADGSTPEAAVPLDASEDGDDEIGGEPVVDLGAIDEDLEVDDPLELVGEEDEDADDTIREGEFVCSSCHMAKRSSALADADEMLCRDCV